MKKFITSAAALALAAAMSLSVFAAGSKTTVTEVKQKETTSTAKVLTVSNAATNAAQAAGTTAGTAAAVTTPSAPVSVQAAAAAETFAISEDTAAAMLEAGYTEAEVEAVQEEAVAAAEQLTEEVVVATILNEIKTNGFEKIIASAKETVKALDFFNFDKVGAGASTESGNVSFTTETAAGVDTSDYKVDVLSAMNVIPDPNNMPSEENPVTMSFGMGDGFELAEGEYLVGLHFDNDTNGWEPVPTTYNAADNAAECTFVKLSPVALVVMENTKVTEAVAAAVAPAPAEKPAEAPAAVEAPAAEEAPAKGGNVALPIGIGAIVAAIGAFFATRKKETANK